MRGSGKWATLGLASLGVLGLLGAGAYPWPIEPRRIVAELNSAIAPVGGMHWGRLGRAQFTLLPWPALRLLDLELLDANGRSVLSAPAAEIGLWPRALLSGALTPMSAKFVNPTALIDLDAARDDVERMAGAPSLPLQRVEVRAGVAKLVSAKLGVDTLIENVDGWLQWTKDSRPLAFSVAGLWRGEPVTLSGDVGAPLELRAGRPSRLVLELAARPADLTFAGTWTPGGKPVVEGDVATKIRSLGAVERWLGLASAPPLAAEELGLQGELVGNSGVVALNEARLEVGGQRFDGALTLSRTAGKTSVSGSLAADALDVSALLGLPGPVLDAAGEWSHQSLLAAPSQTLDLDLRVSAAHASWGEHRIDSAAASVLQRDRRLTIRLLEATDSQGELSGQVSIDAASGGLRTEASAALVDADIGAAMNEWGVTGFEGRGGYDATLRAVGASPAEIAKSLSGSATLELQDGRIDGVNFEEALRRSQRRPVELARDMANGQTAFATARARLDIKDGQAEIAEARLAGPGATVQVLGAIDIADRQWRARIEATQAGAGGQSPADAARLTIGLFGPWAAPAISAVANTE